ncbi:MAG: ribonuclease Z [Candidatus Micrarchaeia archaeon]
MFRVVMLGSGAAIPSPDRCVSCVGIRHKGSVYLLDACEGVQRQMMRFKLSYYRTAAVFISHLHPDHYLGLPGLIYTLQLSDFNGTLEIIGPRGTQEVVHGLMNGRVPAFVKVHEFSGAMQVYTGDGFTVKSFRAEHGIEAYGFVLQQDSKVKFNEKKAKALGIQGPMFSEMLRNGKITVNGKEILLSDVSRVVRGRRIVYSGDTVYSEGTIIEAEGADLLIHDATFTEQHRKDADMKMHATALDAARVASAAKCKRLILTHISNRYDDTAAHLKEAKMAFRRARVAKDGLELDI